MKSTTNRDMGPPAGCDGLMWFHSIKPVLTDIKTCAIAAIAPAGSMRHSKPSHPTERREDGSLIHTRSLSIGIAIEWRRPLPVLDNPKAAHLTGRPVAGPRPQRQRPYRGLAVCFLPAGDRRCPTMIRRAEADVPKADAGGIGARSQGPRRNVGFRGKVRRRHSGITKPCFLAGAGRRPFFPARLV